MHAENILKSHKNKKNDKGGGKHNRREEIKLQK